MAEAVLRIELDDEGGGPSSPPAPAPPQGGAGVAPTPAPSGGPPPPQGTPAPGGGPGGLAPAPDGATKDQGKDRPPPSMLERATDYTKSILAPLPALGGPNQFAGLAAASQSAAAALSALPVAGGAAGMALSAFGQVVQAAGAVVTSFVERGKQLADFSPDLAQAGARAEVRQLERDMREAQDLGPGIARLSDAQEEAWDAIADLLMPIKKFIVETLAGTLEWAAPAIRETSIYLRQIWEVVSQLPNLLAESVNPWGDVVQKVSDLNAHLVAIRKVAEEDAKKEKGDALDVFLSAQMDAIIRRRGVIPGGAP